ncbi:MULTISPECIES: helix-hairpin-helix domain-containing protein [Staphylococcus]|uniref:Transporter n=2 Tax=Staphylococcus TaxID=1279 RepID=A0A418ILH2_STAXY|nr:MULTISPECIES: helix-hairpin-helix domain-containing protein [Staphylococcus]MBF0814018.1 helix-hairpin-helix domain-containing protein [Staphylococcus saprophyticus]MDW8542312.1 helix-hairpin-helix domain-containing protein [Staphylococcus sp. KG4-1]MRF37786.1 transporter [Staphylococcus sp. KY49P]MDW8561679.1 helix-hairpin-helix domain-containing protein [Staphylococcus sp. KG4-3]NQD98617.1 transporter [Staphylococcus xylosus]
MLFQWERWKEIINKYKIIFSIISIVLLLTLIFLGNKFIHTDDKEMNEISTVSINKAASESQSNETESNIKRKENPRKSKNEVIIVDVKGAVKHPNIYEMKSTDRVKQLLDKAQVLDNADLSTINLAEKLLDQKVIYIPQKGETAVASTNDSSKSNNHQQDQTLALKTELNDRQEGKINLNSASETQLLSVNGIGPTKAKSIIEYREQHGNFESVEQLKEVKGIGSKTLEKISDYFVV